jgi:hypothetical protein
MFLLKLLTEQKGAATSKAEDFLSQQKESIFK